LSLKPIVSVDGLRIGEVGFKTNERRRLLLVKVTVVFVTIIPS
jgi:hypothetical protein